MRSLALATTLAGVIEAISIWYAVGTLGKQALLPFIRLMINYGVLGLSIVSLLRCLLVYTIHRLGDKPLLAALLAWWLLWIPINLS